MHVLMRILSIFDSKMESSSQFCTYDKYNQLVESMFGPSECNVHFVFPDGRELHAHSALLASLCPVFKREFAVDSEWDNNDGRVQAIADSTFETYEALLPYFYKRQVVISVGNALGLAHVASYYELGDVVADCAEFMAKHVSVDNVIGWLAFALHADANKLVRACDQFICANTASVLESRAFHQCNDTLLQAILTVKTISCPESTVFDACIEWAKSQCQRDGIDALDYGNLRDQLATNFGLIRIEEMSRQEIVDRRTQIDGLLYPHERADFVWGLLSNDIVVNRRQLAVVHFDRYEYDYPRVRSVVCDGTPESKMYFSLSKTVIFTGLQIPNVFDETTDGRALCPHGVKVTIRLSEMTIGDASARDWRSLLYRNDLEPELDSGKPTIKVTLSKEQILKRDRVYELTITLIKNHPDNVHHINMHRIGNDSVNGIDLSFYGKSVPADHQSAGPCAHAFGELTSSESETLVAGLRFRKLDANSLAEVEPTTFFDRHLPYAGKYQQCVRGENLFEQKLHNACM